MKHRPISVHSDYAVTHSEEDVKIITGWHQDVTPTIKHVQKVRDMHSYATKSSNPNEWRHVGSVPIAIIVDWNRRNGYTFSQWARNEDGAKDKFLKYFLSRDFSKLHNMHITTKKESVIHTVPKSITRDAVDLSGVL
jgi:hypothetical protein